MYADFIRISKSSQMHSVLTNLPYLSTHDQAILLANATSVRKYDRVYSLALIIYDVPTLSLVFPPRMTST